MNQHENDLNPWPLPDFGFKVGGCCQVVKPGADRTPSKPVAIGRHRLLANSVAGLSAVEFLVQGDIIPWELESIPKKYAENCDFIFRKINLPGTPECIDATVFRRQTTGLAYCAGKTGNKALNAIIRSFMQFDEVACINLGKSMQMQCGAVKTHFELIDSTPAGNQKTVKNPFRGRKTVHSKWSVGSSGRRYNQTENGIEIHRRFSKN